jgi:hypothetical protein
MRCYQSPLITTRCRRTLAILRTTAFIATLRQCCVNAGCVGPVCRATGAAARPSALSRVRAKGASFQAAVRQRNSGNRLITSAWSISPQPWSRRARAHTSPQRSLMIRGAVIDATLGSAEWAQRFPKGYGGTMLPARNACRAVCDNLLGVLEADGKIPSRAFRKAG